MQVIVRQHGVYTILQFRVSFRGWGGWLLPFLGAHLPSLELLDYHMGYSLSIPYSEKTKFCHSLSQCLNESLLLFMFAASKSMPIPGFTSVPKTQPLQQDIHWSTTGMETQLPPPPNNLEVQPQQSSTLFKNASPPPSDGVKYVHNDLSLLECCLHGSPRGRVV